jgi:type II secretory pathway pseudopilin PulG
MHPLQHRPTQARQRGAALIVMLVITVMGAAAFLVSSLSRSALQIERDQKTSEALAQAKEALIGYAASVDISGSKRPGDLPCPDTNNDGSSDTPCDTQSSRLGRLPWKTLGLPDLRDASGERLWYAVSTNFKNSTRIGTLNSDTAGTITVRSPDGNMINDATSGSGAAAVIIAPGDALQRQGGSMQDRSSAGINTASNYLDIANGIDNASFTDSTTNGFIQGRIKDSNGNLILNDQLLVITQGNIMQAIQKRVAAEVKQCLKEYALQNHGRYPWATRLDPYNPVSYNDRSNRLFGRIPDTPFDSTKNDSNDFMDDNWQGNCNIVSNSGWWLNWKEMVFYGLADAYKPVSPVWQWWTGWSWPPTACPTCLSVNPPSATADKQFVVLVAGKKLAGQSRSSNWNKGTLSNYLEGGNASGATPFEQQPASSTFNDTVVFQ